MIELNEANLFLTRLAELSGGIANETLSKIGTQLRAEMAKKGRAYGSVPFGADTSDSKGRKLLGSKADVSKPAYEMRSHFDNKTMGNLGDLVRSKLYDKSHTLLVGFFAVKSWSPDSYRNGEIVGKYGRIKGLGKEIKTIAKYVEEGGTQTLSDKQKKLFRASGWSKVAEKGFIVREARPLINGSVSTPIIISRIQKGMSEALRSTQQNINLNEKIK
ncbi:hypothetical protein YY92_08175 [Campylobacter fetus]|uniref:hypothetical protein n=1 Tax=Campylobacter fetus TaxID=196 RepID=UPI0011C8E775|nr:hypothetical protein [Campylobacter fetus]EAJ1232635.1 hypothetical protein [Campylobacter fetus]EAK0414686.1 hypothetical protein [Campylobacter fetus]TXF09198.1 hypothetical protein FPD25_03430 [Campylobacter fetus subsp. fetus]